MSRPTRRERGVPRGGARASATMQGYRIHSWGGDPVWEEFGRPVPGLGEVLVEVEACGVGLTVLNYIRGDLARDPELLPRVPGHEIVGRVIDAGPGGATALVGERVAAYFYLVCGRCRPCLTQVEPRCERLAGWVGVHRDGGYAPFVVLPALNAVPIPAHLEAAEATVIPDAVATALHVCTGRARIRPGECVAVVGAAGGVGIHLVQVARLCGGTVMGLDIGDAKLEALDALGIEPLESRDFDALESSWQGRPPDVIVDLLGSERSLSWAAGALAPGGRLVLLTTFRTTSVQIQPRLLVLGEQTVVGSKYASRAELAAAADLVASRRVTPIIGQQAGPGEVLEIHEALRSGALVGRGALRW